MESLFAAENSFFRRWRRGLLLLLLPGLTACVSLGSPGPVVRPAASEAARELGRPPKVVLALGGGAARGFAHVGVIKALETHGIVADAVVGTSAGSVVGALYAAGYGPFDLQKLAMQLDEKSISDWSLPDRGVLKGDALQKFVNDAVRQQPIEKLPKPFAAVATDLRSGQQIVFRQGNVGMAVRASSSVPGVFQPVAIQGKEYVDGGLTSPIPVRAARALVGPNDVVVAVDISSKPQQGAVRGTFDILMQTFTIMGNQLGAQELREADVVIRPAIPQVGSADFKARHEAILEGEKAALAALPAIRAKLGRTAN